VGAEKELIRKQIERLEADKNKDGSIQFEEFTDFVHRMEKSIE